MRFVLLSLTVLACACGGQVQTHDRNTGAAAGSAGSAGSAQTGGSSGSAGAAHAGSAGAPGACKAGTCELVPSSGCCGSCTPALSDLAAVQYEHRDEYMKSICPEWPVMCEPCLEPSEWNYAAFCESGACAAIDVRKHDVSACASTDECTLETAGCCPVCNPSSNQVVALNKAKVAAYKSQLCNPDYDYGCPGCKPVLPANLDVECVNGQCMGLLILP